MQEVCIRLKGTAAFGALELYNIDYEIVYLMLIIQPFIFMKATDINIHIIDNYFGLLKNLSPDNKLELITKLSNSLKSSKQEKEKSLNELFGAFKSKKSADQIIDEIHQSRTFNRKTESL